MTQLSDEILIAYADGELGDAQMRAVEQVMAADPPTGARLRLLDSSQKRLTASFQSMRDAELREMAAEMAAERLINHPAEHFERIETTPPSVQAPPAVPPMAQKKGEAPEPERSSPDDRAAASTAPRSPRHDRSASGVLASVLVERLRSPLVPMLAAGVLLVSLGVFVGYLFGGGGEGERQAGSPGGSGFWKQSEAELQRKRFNDMVREVAPPDNAAPPQTTASTAAKGIVPQGKWFDALARQHQKQIDSVIDGLVGATRNRELALFEISRSGAAPRLIPSLVQEELAFVGADSLEVRGRPYTRLVYRDVKNGSIPVSLYVTPAKGGSLSLERGYEGAQNFVRWNQNGRKYLLIGKVPHWRLIVISVGIQRELVK